MLFVLNGYFIDNYPCISLIDAVMLARSRCADLERANHLQIKDYEGKMSCHSQMLYSLL